MPNGNTIAGAGAGFFDGFNRFFGPFVMNQVSNQQQAQFQNEQALRKELFSTATPLMENGLIDENNPDEAEALAYMYSSTAGSKQPKNLATTMAVWRGKMARLQEGIGSGELTPEPAPLPEGVAGPPQPKSVMDQRMDQAIQRGMKIREGGGTISFPTRGGGRVSYAGQTFTEQEKRKLNKAYHDFNRGEASLDEILGSAGLGPKEETIVRDRVAMDTFTQLVEQGAGRKEAAKAAIVGTRSMLPTLVEMAFGTEKAAEQAIATGRARMSLIPEEEALRTDALVDRQERLTPGAVDRAQKIEEGKTPEILKREEQRTPVLVDRQQQMLPGEIAKVEQTERARTPEIIERERQRTPIAVDRATQTGRAEIGLIPERAAAENQARLQNPRTPEDRARAVEAGTLSPEANTRIQKTLQGEDRPKLAGPTAAERTAIAEREAKIEQLNRIDALLPKMKVLGKVWGTLAGISEEYLDGLGLSEDDLTGMAEINNFRNDIIKLISGGAVPAAEAARVEKQLPDITKSSVINRVRIKQTKNNLKVLQRKYGDVLFQSGVTNLPASVDPRKAEPSPAPAAPAPEAPAVEPAPFKILSVEPVEP